MTAQPKAARAPGGAAGAVPASRGQVLAFRAAAHGVERRSGDPAAANVLAGGVQDYPVGASAHLALHARTAGGAPDDLDRLLADGVLSLVHAARGAAHVHLTGDLGLFAAALRFDDPRDVAGASGGPFWGELAEQGISASRALDEVAAAMRQVMSDGASRTKGELSTVIQPAVDLRLRPWCEGCQAHHVQDQLFRLATRQAGLRLRRTRPSDQLCFLPPLAAARPDDADEARREIVRRFLRLCGPAGPDQLASWLGLERSAARRIWRLAGAELAEVNVAGRRAWMLDADLDDLRAAPEPAALRLLPPYDPWAEFADRTFLVPDPARRREAWRAVANPGLLLAAGEISGGWRQRTTRDRLVVTVRPFQKLDAALRREVGSEAEDLARFAGLSAAEVRIEE